MDDNTVQGLPASTAAEWAVASDAESLAPFNTDRLNLAPERRWGRDRRAGLRMGHTVPFSAGAIAVAARNGRMVRHVD